MSKRTAVGNILGLKFGGIRHDIARKAARRFSRVSDAFAELLEPRTLLSTTYYVSPSGSNSNSGTSINSAFQTIQAAANVAGSGGSGDVVIIEPGTYRETVTPMHSNVTFEGNGTQSNPVVVSGTNLITGQFSQVGTSSIYQISQGTNLGEGNNQVFVDGQMLNEARWPSTSLDLAHPTLATAGNGTNSTEIFDPALTQSAGFWTNATIHITPGPGEVAYTGSVTNSGSGWIDITLPSGAPAATSGNQYYLTGSQNALQGSGEWYIDHTSSVLSIWDTEGDSPTSRRVEVKARQYAFNVTGVSGTTIEDLSIFGAGILADYTSSSTIINNIVSQYSSVYGNIVNGYQGPDGTNITPPPPTGTAAIDLLGPNNIVENSTINDSAGDGVWVSGGGTQIIGNIFNDVDYSATDGAAVSTYASSVVVNNNQINYAGRDGLNLRGHNDVADNNVIQNFSLQTSDNGGIYTKGDTSANGTFNNNTISNGHKNLLAGYEAVGVYLDVNASGFTVENNKVLNVDDGFKVNGSTNSTIIGNWFDGSTAATAAGNVQPTNWAGSTVDDNTFGNSTVFIGSNASDPGTLAAPSGLRMTSSTTASVGLAWNSSSGDGSNAPTGYAINRQGPGGGAFLQVGTTTTTAFTDNASTDPNNVPQSGTTYIYAVVAMYGQDNAFTSNRVTAVTPSTGGSLLSDGSFEQTSISGSAPNNFQYNPTSAWAFESQVAGGVGGSGVSGNGSYFTGSVHAPDGSQVAFLQAQGFFSQSVNTAAGTYVINFLAAQRGQYQAGPETFQVLVDGTSEGMFTPSSTSYQNYTAQFALSAGSHSIKFIGLNSGDDTALIDVVQLMQSSAISDGSFEQTAISGSAPNNYQYNPSSAWTFESQVSGSLNGSGVSGNGSYFTNGNPTAPQGGQVAFLQGQGFFSQPVSLSAGTYVINFIAAQRGQYQSHRQDFQVLINNTVEGTFDPSGPNYVSLSTSSFTVAAGTYTVEFLGLDTAGGDNTALIDNVILATQQAGIANGGFESPSIPNPNTPTAYQYNPTGAGVGWTFSSQSGTNGSGISDNGTDFTAANPATPEGGQVAFLQGQGSFSETVAQGTGTYFINFLAAQRGQYQASRQDFQVLVNGVVEGSFTPLGSHYSLFSTGGFTLPLATNTITFKGIDSAGGDNTALIDSVELATQTSGVANGGFESPNVGTGTNAYQYNPSGAGWNFSSHSGTNGSGISGNGSDFTSGNPNSPEGGQVAFLQGQGSFSQQIYVATGTYVISFLAAQRGIYQQGAQSFSVQIDSNVYTFGPTSTSYAAFSTSQFSLSAGSHTITFLGLNSGDDTALIDNVQLYTLA
jgi:hypothetical protein